jgi:hypothetical protein
MASYKDFEPNIPEFVTSNYLGEKVKWMDIEYIGFDQGYYVYNSFGYVDKKKTYTSILEFTIDGDFDNVDYIEKI